MLNLNHKLFSNIFAFTLDNLPQACSCFTQSFMFHDFILQIFYSQSDDRFQIFIHNLNKEFKILTLLHSEQTKLQRVLAILSAIGLNPSYTRHVNRRIHNDLGLSMIFVLLRSFELYQIHIYFTHGNQITTLLLKRSVH